MKLPGFVEAYEKKNALPLRPLVAGGLDGIERAVVIPVLAEKESLFATLTSLSRNSPHELARTLILCVINNRGSHIASRGEINDNQETIRILYSLIKGGACLSSCNNTAVRRGDDSLYLLRLAYIDASSRGWEMPDRGGGVGTARKIGMDAALTLLDYTATGENLIICLDADTLVEHNYLESIGDYFRGGHKAAVVNYSHQRPVTARERLAIDAYEIFLRYYVLGLDYAGSPYAFPTVGSTMTCRADAYCAVGGMNRQDAAEDFYFLNKLAKYTKVGRIVATTIHPSARASHRVPFGTGRTMTKFIEGSGDPFLLYDPRVFILLRQWLAVVTSAPEEEAEDMLTMAGGIHPLLRSFLEKNNFFEAWGRIRKNIKTPEGLLHHFHVWFDAFKTMKMIRFLTDNEFPQVDMFVAVEGLLHIMQGDVA